MRSLGGLLPAAGAALLLLLNDASLFRFTPRPQTFLFVFVVTIRCAVDNTTGGLDLLVARAVAHLGD